MRYDDTNPEKEEEKYFTAIREMVEWLGMAQDGKGRVKPGARDTPAFSSCSGPLGFLQPVPFTHLHRLPALCSDTCIRLL